MNRCKIKPAFTRSPAERAHAWIQEHLIRVLATAIACTIVWFLVDHVLIGVLNVLGEAAAWDSADAQKFSAASVFVIGTKIVISALCAWFLLFRFRFQK